MAQVKPVNKKKMTKSSLIATVVAVVILVAFALSLMSTSGLFVRATTGASSENFKVNGSMMSYYFNSYYSNWYQTYYYYILLGYTNFNPQVSLKEQYTDATKEETWYDYFVEGTKSTVKSYLQYCEEAMIDPEVNYADYETAAKAYADEVIETQKAAAKEEGMDLNTYLRQIYGKFLSKNDFYNALVIEHIAISYANDVRDRLDGKVTESDEEDYLKKNLASFISADYLTYTLSSKNNPTTVDEKLYELGKEDPAYKEAVAKAQEEAKKKNELSKKIDEEFIKTLSEAKDAEEFKRIILDYNYADTFKTAYEKAVEKFDAADKPSEQEWKDYANEIKQAVIDAVIAEKKDLESEDEEEKSEGEESTETKTEKTKWETAKEALPTTVIANLNSVITTATKSASYTLGSDLGKFLFAGVKAEYKVDYDEGEEEGTNAKVNESLIEDKKMTEEEQKSGKYSLTVYFVTDPAHKDEDAVREAGHILFKIDPNGTNGAYKTGAEAKAAAEKLLAELKEKAVDGVVSKEVFEEMAQVTHDSNIFYPTVKKGDMVEEFDKWLFEAEKIGDLGLVYGENEKYKGWHIVYYGGEDIAWRVSAQDGVTTERLTAWSDDLTHEVTINDSVFGQIYNR